jgi:hypothetical protein
VHRNSNMRLTDNGLTLRDNLPVVKTFVVTRSSVEIGM